MSLPSPGYVLPEAIKADLRRQNPWWQDARIELGRDSLAGRVQTIEIGPLRLHEIAAIRGFAPLHPQQGENNWSECWSEWLRAEFWQALRQSGRPRIICLPLKPLLMVR